MGNSIKKLWPAIGLAVLLIIASLVYTEMLPGSGKGKPQFAPNDQIESLRPFVDEFWSDILGTSYSTSFVSNGSVLSSWEHYLSGGRDELIKKVKDKYHVDITDYYDEPIPVVLTRIKDGNANSGIQPEPRTSGR